MTAMTRVLLVDDEREFTAIISQRLIRRNYSVISACSGRDALTRLAQNNDIDVVILDVKMPELDGVETLKLIKKKWPLVEVLMLTAHSTIDSAISAIKLGAIDYMMKPIEMDQLVIKIDKAAGRKQHREKLIQDVYATPYLTRHEREEKIAEILKDDT